MADAGEGEDERVDAAAQRATRVRETERMVIRIRAVEALADNDNSGDSKLEAPVMRTVKTLDPFGDAVGGIVDSGGGIGKAYSGKTPMRETHTYDYFTYTSDATTRSGYRVTRRNYAAAVQDVRRGVVYALCCSTTADTFDEQKASMFKAMLRSFVVS
mmetsp:Transcript_3869/g.6052  ORF Transcript_3869/g.6052 Transcript_3869/m.6052 type:complete len:158 (+) Transcript_3869:134-607(+)